MAKYVCAICNNLKDSRKEKKYVYASSKKEVKILVCKSCHQRNYRDMGDTTKLYLGKKAVTGVKDPLIEEDNTPVEPIIDEV